MTECNRKRIEFTPQKRQKIVASFDGDTITSDAGLLLVREINERYRVTYQLAECFQDFRNENSCEHTVYQLLTQRIFGICAGDEDLNDHDHLREDRLYSLLVGKENLKEDKPASKSTLNRLEKSITESNPGLSRYKKIKADEEKIANLLVELFVQSYDKPPASIVLDLDATDNPIYGDQEGKFFHGYYGCYCYLPLYITCEDFVVSVLLRPSDIDASKGSLEELERIIGIIRKHWPETKILVRGDSGFCRDSIMSWIEDQEKVEYIFGIATNPRLRSIIEEEIEEAKKLYEEEEKPQRIFTEFQHQPLKKNWARERRVIAKAEYLRRGENPRFIITSLKGKDQYLYEKVYCARGNMENRIKEQQLYLFSLRTSCHKMRENQLRLWFSAYAYTLLHLLRTKGLKGTAMAKAQCHTIRNRLLKIGAVIKISCRRVYFSLSEAFTCKDLLISATLAIRG